MEQTMNQAQAQVAYPSSNQPGYTVAPTLTMPQGQMAVMPNISYPTTTSALAVAQPSQAPTPYQSVQNYPTTPQQSQIPYTQQGYNQAYQQGYSQPDLTSQAASLLQTMNGYRSGNAQYQPQVEAYSPAPIPAQFPAYTQPHQTLTYNQAYQSIYPQASQSSYTGQSSSLQQQSQSLANPVIPAGIAKALSEAGIPYQGVAADNVNGGFATVGELAENFGNLEVAADTLNKYACRVEDLAEQLGQALQYREGQLAEALSVLQEMTPRYEAMEDMLTSPETLSQYYLELEHQLGEIPVQQIVNRVYNQAEQGQRFNQAPPLPNNQAVPAQAAMQYAQQVQTRQIPQAPQVVRPQMPAIQGNSAPTSPAEFINSYPPHLRHQAIDYLQQVGGFRGVVARVA